MRESFKNFLIFFLLGSSIMLLLFSAVYLPAKMRSDSFNRLTGKHTNWKDVIFLELRVQESIKDSVNVRN